MRILYIAYDGKFLSGWWDQKPLDPPQPGKKWSNPGAPQVYGEFGGKLPVIIRDLQNAKILPQLLLKWEVVNEQWAERGIEMAHKLKSKPRRKPINPVGGLFTDEWVGVVEHRPWNDKGSNE